ncbi:Oxaloacetate decarboxylase, gamma chain [Rosistilla carotiformis]|uniref:Oxaloacetate decarboxylase, gamma chain n=1 Tax=Rosistilla carotiformis TaxID=2528017 RepID=A0A518JT85_9BACT|nr:hypothetical protein [Rosistilla carotiformis]QDV68757.1 Oxaloacetate decarboxylase, gamma chain [Rosistilla carotiformis]
MNVFAVTTAAAESTVAANELPQAASIALAGMLIVGLALVLICLFITALPRILAVAEKFWPEVEEHHGRTHPQSDSHVPDDDAVLAAIGFVLHQEFQRQLQTDRPS